MYSHNSVKSSMPFFKASTALVRSKTIWWLAYLIFMQTSSFEIVLTGSLNTHMHLCFRRMGNRVATKVNLGAATRSIVSSLSKRDKVCLPDILFVDHMSKRVAKSVIFFLEAESHSSLVTCCTSDLGKKRLSAIPLFNKLLYTLSTHDL